MELKGTPTHENLRSAFVRKAAAGRLYLYLAKTADNEGRRDLARLFRELSDGETLHCHGLMEHLKAAGDPVTGGSMAGWEAYFQNAVDASQEEAEKLFPAFAAQARADGFEDIAEWFESLSRAEANHASRLLQYKETLYGD
jgi:rubrerythrin